MQHRTHNAEQRAHIGYSRDLPTTDSNAYFRTALSKLLRPGYTLREAIELLGARLSKPAMSRWISGVQEPAPWALDSVRRMLAEQSAALAAIAEQPVTRGPTRSESARRLTPLRRAKEKTRVAARAIGQTESET